MGMKFLADVHISPLTISALNQAGYEATRVTDHLPASAPDTDIIDMAIRENATILTQDLDFSALIARAGTSDPSVVSLRVGDAKPHVISKLLVRVLPQVEEHLQHGAIVSITESEFRVRRLPI